MEVFAIIVVLIIIFNAVNAAARHAKEKRPPPPAGRSDASAAGGQTPVESHYFREVRPRRRADGPAGLRKIPEATSEIETAAEPGEAVQTPTASRGNEKREAAVISHGVASSLAGILQDRDRLVAAFVFHEILQPPRSMRGGK